MTFCIQLEQKKVMTKNSIIIKLHSVVDLITNSSTEMFIIDTSKTEKILKDIFDAIKNNVDGETEIVKWQDYKYKGVIILLDDVDPENVYVCDIDQCDCSFLTIIEKFFTQVNYKYAE